MSSIGNPSGSLEFQKLYSSNASFALAPTKFLDDWSAAIIGLSYISYQHRPKQDFAAGYYGTAYNREIRISGAGGAVTWLGAAPSFSSSFIAIDVPHLESEWTVTSGTWSNLLSDVSSFRLRVERVGI